MVLKIVGNPVSTCTNRVRITLEELGVPYELVAIDFSKGEHKSPEFTAIQPFGQVPYIDDDGFKLYESRAIARYVALKYGGIGKLIPDPKDVRKYGLFEQAASIELSNFDPSASGLAYENIFKVAYGGKTNQDAVAQMKTTLEGKLGAYDVILGKSKYLAGDELTLADLFHIPYGALLEKQGIDYLVSGRWPNVTRWWKDISSRESWKKVAPK
ncbi:hypothetical protein BN946_scf184938.g42 [Trametes cinnabarina]|uniref:glutathione transferase n=1 Tax=Pycnoporus cinnabarinus TaxID=5643 RepID=A0A060S1L9_PYCCI|nr:hypothetical protein BN946_scf184938.g42 [Trametes cinnabarina]